MRGKGRAFFIAIVLTLVLARPVFGVPAYPGMAELAQPDGSVFLARQWGDERMHGWETADGYTIVRDEMSGYWYFARKANNGNLVSCGIRADMPQLLPENFPKHLRPEGAADPREQLEGGAVFLVGVVEYSEVEGPHYELVTLGRVYAIGNGHAVSSKCFLAPYHYVLLGNFKPCAGWLAVVKGQFLQGPNVWMRPAVDVERAVTLIPAFWVERR